MIPRSEKDATDVLRALEAQIRQARQQIENHIVLRTNWEERLEYLQGQVWAVKTLWPGAGGDKPEARS